MIEFSIPELTQLDDQDAILEISGVVDPDFIVVTQARQCVMRIPGDPKYQNRTAAEREARQRFSRLLGVLRGFRHGRGVLQAEVHRSAARDEHGATFIQAGAAIAYRVAPGAIEEFSGKAARGIETSPRFSEALILFGRPNRDASEYYSIYELSTAEFHGPAGIATRLGITQKTQREFKKSANNLPASEGGRHSRNNPSAVSMNLDGLSRFTTGLMEAWTRRF